MAQKHICSAVDKNEKRVAFASVLLCTQLVFLMTPNPSDVSKVAKSVPVAEEGVLAVVLAAGVALFGAFLSYTNVCAEKHACVNAGTCYALTNSTFSCGFKTSITPMSWTLLNFSSQARSLQLMNRGVCVPGMCQTIDPFSGMLECARKRSYPNALSTEIGDASVTAPDHRKYCGSWIDASSVVTGEYKWAFFDDTRIAEDVEATFSSW